MPFDEQLKKKMSAAQKLLKGLTHDGLPFFVIAPQDGKSIVATPTNDIYVLESNSLGCGLDGCVYLGAHCETGEQFAVKISKYVLGRGAELKSLMQRISEHPGFLRIVSFGIQVPDSGLSNILTHTEHKLVLIMEKGTPFESAAPHLARLGKNALLEMFLSFYDIFVSAAQKGICMNDPYLGNFLLRNGKIVPCDYDENLRICPPYKPTFTPILRGFFKISDSSHVALTSHEITLRKSALYGRMRTFFDEIDKDAFPWHSEQGRQAFHEGLAEFLEEYVELNCLARRHREGLPLDKDACLPRRELAWEWIDPIWKPFVSSFFKTLFDEFCLPELQKRTDLGKVNREFLTWSFSIILDILLYSLAFTAGILVTQLTRLVYLVLEYFEIVGKKGKLLFNQDDLMVMTQIIMSYQTGGLHFFVSIPSSVAGAQVARRVILKLEEQIGSNKTPGKETEQTGSKKTPEQTGPGFFVHSLHRGVKILSDSFPIPVVSMGV